MGDKQRTSKLLLRLRRISKLPHVARPLRRPWYRLLIDGDVKSHKGSEIVAELEEELGKRIKVRHIIVGRHFYQFDGFDDSSGIPSQHPVQEYLVYYTILKK